MIASNLDPQLLFVTAEEDRETMMALAERVAKVPPKKLITVDPTVDSPQDVIDEIILRTNPPDIDHIFDYQQLAKAPAEACFCGCFFYRDRSKTPMCAYWEGGISTHKIVCTTAETTLNTTSSTEATEQRNTFPFSDGSSSYPAPKI